MTSVGSPGERFDKEFGGLLCKVVEIEFSGSITLDRSPPKFGDLIWNHQRGTYIMARAEEGWQMAFTVITGQQLASSPRVQT